MSIITLNLNTDFWNGWEGNWIDGTFVCRALCPQCEKENLRMYHLPEAPGSRVGEFVDCNQCNYQKIVHID